MLQSFPLLGARLSALALVTDPGTLLDAKGLVVQSETVSTSMGALSTEVLGAVGPVQLFRFQFPAPVRFCGRFNVRVPWTLTTQSPTAASRGTMRASLTIAGTTVVSALSGAPRNLNSANGTLFTELLALAMSTPVLVNAGDVIELRIQAEITTISGVGADVFTPTLRHNPELTGDQLVMELQGGALVVSQ